MKILKVAMISEHGDPLAVIGGQQSGGQNIYILELAKALSNRGIFVDVFTRWDNRKTAHIVKFAKRAKVIRLKAGPRQFILKEKFGPLMPEFLEHFLEYSRTHQIKYDIIHSHYYFSGWVALKLKKILNIPVVSTYHSLGIVKKELLGKKDASPSERIVIENEIAKDADKIIATSPNEKLILINRYNADRDRIAIVPAGVNTKRFHPINKNTARNKLKLDINNKIILFAGKMEKRKGGLDLIHSILKIKQINPHLYSQLQVIMISGDPRVLRNKEKMETGTRYSLEYAIKKLKLADKITLLPGMTQDKLRFYYASADAVAMPSHYEPFGMVALESMATGTPVIASRVGGLKWIIEDEITGLLFKPKNTKQIADRVINILSDNNFAMRLGRNAQIRASRYFNWQLIAKKILDVYQSVIKQ